MARLIRLWILAWFPEELAWALALGLVLWVLSVSDAWLHPLPKVVVDLPICYRGCGIVPVCSPQQLALLAPGFEPVNCRRP